MAEAICQRRGEQWTAPRRRTYELLLKAGGPVKAYDLISTFAQAGESLAKPPTIYRALDFLLAQGLVTASKVSTPSSPALPKTGGMRLAS